MRAATPDYGGRKVNGRKCWRCGGAAETYRMEHFGKTANGSFYQAPADDQNRWRAYCKACHEAVTREMEETRAELARLKKRVMFENAMQILEGQAIDMYELRESIDAVEEFLQENPDSFDSAHEVVAAIILIHNRVRCKPQYKVGRYLVDFLLPDEMVVLEIDGDRHKLRKVHDSNRDKKIKRELGPDWEIVRISTEYIEQNAKCLVTALRKVCEFRIFGNTQGVNRRSGD